ncbi:alpha/beta hydrolase [Deinococcus cellulosilyticus]|uniref:Serine aminopeptidase S33 domain-containing protein n=1 Tax=Deinococcus cellulosilyticus (strain DSM 18568 / NBRC 106333 / KACC 11606 / 5516J-15) TaxID=1223518 RepID=A0A511MZF2_DEIC1|nr:alpha/beta fold hydrolase [Deinococcus cellulosilyticus]GEM46000.1 hypothetical protein DC3_16350 [Deinococcus cellulosilyticus NBRC 106333 = KACC 11606]
MPALFATLVTGVSLFVLLLTIAIVMVFMGDPVFPPQPALSVQDVAALQKRYMQVNPHQERIFTLKDGDHISGRVFPGTSNTTVVLLHGVLSSSLEMNRTAGLMQKATGSTVIAVDLRGHGKSSGHPGDLDHPGQYEEDVAEVIWQLRKNQPDRHILLAGHSMGGGIALRYAVRSNLPPVDGFVLLAPHMGDRSPTTPRTSPNGSSAFIKVHVARTIGLKFLNVLHITPFNHLKTLHFNLPEGFPLRSYSFNAMVSMSPEDTAKALQSVRAPLLVVVGSKDEAFVAAEYPPVVQKYSNGQVSIIEGAGHDGILTDPRTFEAIARWTQSHLSAP